MEDEQKEKVSDGVIQAVNEGKAQTGCEMCDREEGGSIGEVEVEGESGWEQEQACDWAVVADSEGLDENTSGGDNE